MSVDLLYSRLFKSRACRDKLLATMEKDSAIPAFPDTARKLLQALREEDVALITVEEIVELDPGISAQFLRLAGSPLFGARQITDLHHALMLIGMEEVRKLGTGMLVMNGLKQLHLTVDWELFWLHSLLTARITERIAGSFQDLDGKEYLAGLLHDHTSFLV